MFKDEKARITSSPRMPFWMTEMLPPFLRSDDTCDEYCDSGGVSLKLRYGLMLILSLRSREEVFVWLCTVERTGPTLILWTVLRLGAKSEYLS